MNVDSINASNMSITTVSRNWNVLFVLMDLDGIKDLKNVRSVKSRIVWLVIIVLILVQYATTILCLTLVQLHAKQ